MHNERERKIGRQRERGLDIQYCKEISAKREKRIEKEKMNLRIKKREGERKYKKILNRPYVGK